VDNIKAKSTNAVIWSAVDKFSAQGIRFILGLIIARLLLPSDYGLIGMLAVFLALPNVFIQSGFGAALIQKKSADDTDFSTVFYFNIFVGIFMYFVLYITAPLIADFYDEPKLTLLTRVLGFTMIIESFAIVQRTILTKNLDFKIQTKISISSILPSGIIGVLFAFYGYGVWALVFQSLSRQFFLTVFFWIFNKWRPQVVFSTQSIKSLFSFGSKLLISGLLNAAFTRIQLIVIGKVYDAASLGFYTRAKQLQSFPVQSLSQIINRVSFPIFSKLQDDNKKLLNAYRKIAKMAVFVNFPVMVGLIIVSEPLINLILTEKWLPSVPYLRVMCIGGLLGPIHVLALSVITAKGDSGLFLKLDIVKKVMILTTILITYRWGVMAIVTGFTILSFFIFYLNFYFAGKKLNFSFRKQLRDLLPYLLISIVMGIFMIVAGNILSMSDIIKILIQLFTGIVIYVFMSRLFKVEAYYETLDILNTLKSKFKQNK